MPSDIVAHSVLSWLLIQNVVRVECCAHRWTCSYGIKVNNLKTKMLSIFNNEDKLIEFGVRENNSVDLMIKSTERWLS